MKTLDAFERIIKLEWKKLQFHPLRSNTEFVTEAAKRVGSQSVVAVIDVKKLLFRRYEVVTKNASKKTGFEPASWAAKLQSLGAGEILLNPVDADGQMQGYDFDLVDEVRSGGINSLNRFGWCWIT